MSGQKTSNPTDKHRWLRAATLFGAVYGVVGVAFPNPTAASEEGGADVDPAVYGEQPSGTIGPIDATRDRFELDLLRAFVAWRKPVFGICRGCN